MIKATIPATEQNKTLKNYSNKNIFLGPLSVSLLPEWARPNTSPGGISNISK